jgi:hypothetical protein
MSDQPEHEQATSGQAKSLADPTSPAQFNTAPVIRTDPRPAAAGKGRGSGSRHSPRKAIPAFDAAAINRLVELPSAEPDSLEEPSSVVASEPANNGTDEPIAEQACSAVEAADAEDGTAAASVEREAEPASGAWAAEPNVPVISAAGTRDRQQRVARRAGRSRQAKPRRPWNRASGWILFGVCGASALLATALLVNQVNRPTGDGAAVPREGSRTPNPASDSQAPRSPESKPRGFSRTGVSPMDAEERARRREGIDSFAEMGRAEEDRLHREKPKADATRHPK